MEKMVSARAAPVDLKAVEVLKRHKPLTVVLDAFDIHALEKQIRADTEMWNSLLDPATERYPGQLQNKVNMRNEDVANRLMWALRPLASGPLAEAIAARDQAVRQYGEKQLAAEPE